MNGWIKLHRSLVEWEWYTDGNVSRVFIHCLLLANTEPKKWRGELIYRGSFISSIANISSGVGLSVKAVRLAFDKLKLTNEINIKGASGWSVITVCNYELYQGSDNTEGQTNAPTNAPSIAPQKGSPKGKQRATTKEHKKKRNKESISPGTGEPAPVDSIVTKIRDSFELFYSAKKPGEKYYFTAKDGKHAKELAKKISFRLKEKKTPVDPTDENIIKSFNALLERLPKWHIENLSLVNINSKFNEIIASLTKGSLTAKKEISGISY